MASADDGTSEAEGYALRITLNPGLARDAVADYSEAVASGNDITLCPLNAQGDACMNSTSWSNGWAVVQGSQAEARASLGDDLLRVFDAAITVQAGVAGVTFDDQGATSDSTWLLICDQSGGQGHRQLELTPIGRVLTETYGSDDQSC